MEIGQKIWGITLNEYDPIIVEEYFFLLERGNYALCAAKQYSSVELQLEAMYDGVDGAEVYALRKDLVFASEQEVRAYFESLL